MSSILSYKSLTFYEVIQLTMSGFTHAKERVPVKSHNTRRLVERKICGLEQKPFCQCVNSLL